MFEHLFLIPPHSYDTVCGTCSTVTYRRNLAAPLLFQRACVPFWPANNTKNGGADTRSSRLQPERVLHFRWGSTPQTLQERVLSRRAQRFELACQFKSPMRGRGGKSLAEAWRRCLHIATSNQCITNSRLNSEGFSMSAVRGAYDQVLTAAHPLLQDVCERIYLWPPALPGCLPLVAGCCPFSHQPL